MTNPLSTSPASPASAEERVSVLVGDRLCASCSYNLAGQPIVREPHYRLLIVRCPECGTVASVQEYPLLGRWANRWAMALAGLWLLFLLLMWLATAGALFGFCMGASTGASQEFGGFIDKQFEEYIALQQQTATTAAGMPTVLSTGQVRFSYGYYGPAGFTPWWDTQNPAALLQQAGGFWRAIDLQALLIWVPLALVAVATGVFWSVALMGRSRKALLAFGLVEMLAVGSFAAIAYYSWMVDGPSWTWDAAMKVLGPRMMGLSLVVTAAALAAGLMVGRPVARGLVRLFLTPRLRGPLATLWIADGLTPPVPAGASLLRRVSRAPNG